MTSHQRIYAPDECGPDGYPFAWHKGEPAIKDHIREQAGNRCQRCGHPYAKGDGEWSACDERCAHWGPSRHTSGEPVRRDDQMVDRGLLVRGGAHIEAQWRVLTVHHLNQVKADCRWWNLTSLCQRCHLLVQRRVHMEQVWPHEHSEWFKPHAAGYYATTYLGLDLTRDETLARLDELLSLERVA